jgi:hypothetical protein
MRLDGAVHCRHIQMPKAAAIRRAPTAMISVVK